MAAVVPYPAWAEEGDRPSRAWGAVGGPCPAGVAVEGGLRLLNKKYTISSTLRKMLIEARGCCERRDIIKIIIFFLLPL